jgi:hypothetical protein
MLGFLSAACAATATNAAHIAAAHWRSFLSIHFLSSFVSCLVISKFGVLL